MAERAIYNTLDNALDFVGSVRVGSNGALHWLSVAGDDSGQILCTPVTVTRFSCSWKATLIQSYRGTVRVAFHKQSPQLVFLNSTCVNPHHPGVSYPNLCALDPVLGCPTPEATRGYGAAGRQSLAAE